MPETESNATKSRLEKFIDGCSQLTEIYAVTPLDYTNIMGEWWQRINDIIYTLGLTETQNTPVTIAWTVPVPGRKRSPFFEEEIATKTPDGTTVSETSRVSHVAGDGTGQQKAHKYGFIQSVDKLFQRNINTWGSLYEALYANSKDTSANPNGVARPTDLTDLIFGKTGLSKDQINALLTAASRGLDPDSQGLANSMKNVIENVIGTSLYDWLQEHSVDGANGIGGIEELLFGTHDKDQIADKINEITDNGTGSLFDKTNEIVDTFGENLYNWLNNGPDACIASYSAGNANGPFTLEEVLFGKWSSDGTSVDGRETTSNTPSWCDMVSKLKSGGLLTEIYNVVNYLGEPYDTYVDKANQEKDATNTNIPTVNEEYQKDDPMHQLQALGVGQVIYGARNSKNEQSYENDWIFKEANICQSDKETQNLIESFKDQKKIFETFNRISWADTTDDPERNDLCFPKVKQTAVIENGITVNAVTVDGYQMAYIADKVEMYAGEQVSEKEVRLMPYPNLETKIENRIGELPGYKNVDGYFEYYSTPQGYKANVQKGEWFNITQDGTYAGHKCKKDDFLLCKATGAANTTSTWKVISHDLLEFAGFNTRRVVPSWDTHFDWREVCDEANKPIRLKIHSDNGEAIVSTPQLPYEVGDVYSIGETARYMNAFNCNEGDILICINAKSADEAVASGDWNRVVRGNVKRDASGHVEGFYKWWPTTQTITATSNPLIYEFWKNYTGPYVSYQNVPLFYSREEFKNLLPTAVPEADSNDPNKAIWDPKYHEVYYLGSIGQDGEYESLPNDAKVGTALRVEAPGIYDGQKCKINDTLVCIQSGTGDSNPAKWKNINRNLNRNYGYIATNSLYGNYGIQNVQSSTMVMFPHTLRTEKIQVGENIESYKTVTGCSWSSDSNYPQITGNLTSLILNKEAKVHTGVSGNWNNGYSLNDVGADYSTLTVDIPYSGRYYPQANNNNCKQFYWSYLISWLNPIYKDETLLLKQTVMDDLATGWSNTQWIVYNCTFNETTKTATLGDPKYVLINGISYPAIKQTINNVPVWGIMFKGSFHKINDMPVGNRKDRPQYDIAFQVVKYTTTYSTIYRGRDGNNNIQMTFTGTGGPADAAKARTLFNANRLSRIERADIVRSTKKSWVFTSTQTNTNQNGTIIRTAVPTIKETTTQYSSELNRFKFINANALRNDPNIDTIIGYPNQYPFTTQKWLKETDGETIIDPTDQNNLIETSNYGLYGGCCGQITTNKVWKLNGTMQWVDDATDSANSHWNISGTWVQEGRTDTTETVNRPLRLVYYWDVQYYFKYRAWDRNNLYYNAANSYYTDWMTYNIPNVEMKVNEWIQSTDILKGIGIPVNTTSTAFRGEMSSWNIVEENPDEYVIKIGTNSNSFLALTSNKKYGNFKFDCTPMSYTDDDDDLGFVICHAKDNATGLDNALNFDRWSTGMRLRINNNITLVDINAKPVIRNLNGAYNYGRVHYGETIYRPIITDGDDIYTEDEINSPYNLATFTCSNKTWTNRALFAWKMYTQHEGPTSYGTVERVDNGIEYTDANGEKVKSTSTYQNVKLSAQTMLDLIKPVDDEATGTINNIVMKRSWSDSDASKLRAASSANNMYGLWIVPFHTKMTADTYWDRMNDPIRAEIISSIKAMMRDSNNNAPTDSEAIAIFKTIIYPRHKLSTFNVDDFTLDDARKLHNPTQYITTVKVIPGATTLNLNCNSNDSIYANNAYRWIFAGYGWLNLYSAIDLNYRTIIERKMNKATNSYDLLITYKDVLHRLATTPGTDKRRFSNNSWAAYNSDEGFNWHKSTTNNQAYKGDIIIKGWKTNLVGVNEYNFLAWQLRNNATPIPLVLVNIDDKSYMRTRTYDLTLTGNNIPVTDNEGNPSTEQEKDFHDIPLKSIIGTEVDIFECTSTQSNSDLAHRGIYKILNQLMTSIVSYGYLNCSNPLSEYRKIKFVDTTSGEIYDLSNNRIWTPNSLTNEYEVDSSKNYNVEQAIMKKFGVGRFLYNSETGHMFFTRGDTDSVQKII